MERALIERFSALRPEIVTAPHPGVIALRQRADPFMLATLK